jgi:hypothetical protein
VLKSVGGIEDEEAGTDCVVLTNDGVVEFLVEKSFSSVGVNPLAVAR